MALDIEYTYESGSFGGWPDDVERGTTPYNTSSGASLTSLGNVFNLVTQTSDGVPARYGTKCGEFKVRPGDKYFTSTGERTIARSFSTGEVLGSEYYYGFSTYWPSNWVSSVRGWALFHEWHGPGGTVAPVRMLCQSGGLQVAVFGGATNNPNNVTATIDTLTKGVWNDFIVRIKWQKDASGLIEVWHKLATQTDYVKKATLTGPVAQTVNGVDQGPYYTLAGFYRGDYADSAGNTVENTTHTIYHDYFRRGTTYEDIAGGTSPPPPSSWPPPNSFGQSDLTGSLFGSVANSIRAYRTTATASGSITQFKMWIEPQASSGTEQRKVVAYSDSSSEPGTLLGTSNELSIAPTDTAGEYTFPLATNIPITSGTKYWLGTLDGGTGNVAQTRSVPSGSFRYVTRSYTDGAPSSWDTAGDSAYSFEMALVAVYQTQTSTGSSSHKLEAYVQGQSVAGASLSTSSVSTTTSTPTRVAWVPTVSYQPVVRGEFREIDAQGSTGAAVKWNQALNKWEYL